MLFFMIGASTMCAGSALPVYGQKKKPNKPYVVYLASDLSGF
jgi:hypothetical protein